MNLNERFKVVRGYIRFTQTKNGKVVREGGFIESSRGLLYGVLDTVEDKIVSARTFREHAERIAEGMNKA
jgi:hypothetical protein